MIVASAVLLFAMNSAVVQGSATTPLSCAIMGGNADPSGPGVDYKGVHYAFCCPMCPGAFAKDPNKAISAERNKGKTIGIFLFDPVSGARITQDKSKASSDYDGVRYLFASADEKTAFDASPAKYTATPAKEALFCPVEKEKIPGYAKAGSYKDYEGVRYFFCCNGCPQKFATDPATFAKNAAEYVTEPKALVVQPEPMKGSGDAPFTAETFNCKHCGREMAINSPDDANSVCSACKCGKTMTQCKPGQK